MKQNQQLFVCLKQEEEAQVLCDHVVDQTKQENVLGGSSKAPEVALATVDQGESVQILSCELLIKPMVSLQLSLGKHLELSSACSK